MKEKFTLGYSDGALAEVYTKKSRKYLISKRFIDVLGSLIGIILCLPIFAIISILIKLESRGPIIFKQRRVGKDNNIFYIYKFRSMKVGSPTKATSEFKDSYKYITRVGRFIRKTSIDELPQFFNILKGDMSFIGPRPVIENEIDLINLRNRCGVSNLIPGVTGWAQINGRDHITTEEKCEYDYEYLKNRSLLFDIKIVIKTIINVIKADGISDGHQ